jgi:hypothetical protein
MSFFKTFFSVSNFFMSIPSSLIEFIDRELETKIGVFFNPKTGNTWKLYIQDGEII